ncbi:LysR family transcriptional regulator [Acetonema longum]|uniref:LysR family transcriptional regulator n=1 Tax=Acetonema longum DSM 6540 TaxID=1009370 RepID=F7NJK8_9FIRM|nr:LysR family transcriptional regulator [Acetonema longum]EGO63774.1 LysR family transcriptional regulator [Acetonema longum DSM 6540]
MDLDDIKVFREVALHGSMTQAAEALGYAQSSVTARIRKLEAELRVTLFYRNAKGVQLTPSGQIFQEQGFKITQLIEELYTQLHPSEVPGGLLHIGAMETTAATRLPSLLKKYHSLHDQVELSLQTGPTDYLINQVLNYELDLAFVGTTINHPEIIETESFKEEMVLVAEKKDHPQDILEIIKSRTILVFRPGCYYRSLLEQYLRETAFIPFRRFEFGSLEAIIGGVSAGIGISLLPKSVIEDKLQSGALAAYELPPHLRMCTTMLIQRKDTIPTAAITNFVDLIKNLR